MKTENGGFTANANIKVVSYYKNVGKSYTANDGLTVTLNELNYTNHSTYYEYSISYTLENKTDSLIDEGIFKMFYKGTSGGVAQYGFFGKLAPGDKESRSYTWQVKHTKPVFDVLEYGQAQNIFVEGEPSEKNLNWKVNTNK